MLPLVPPGKRTDKDCELDAPVEDEDEVGAGREAEEV
jgi:hypothetical protein